MSKESRWSTPASAPRVAAARAPAAGPDSSSRMGKRVAVSTVAIPPDDSITKKDPSNPRSERRSSSPDRYCSARGWTYTLAMVVEARSYSRISGATSEEMETRIPGAARFTARRAARSLAGLAKPWRKLIATASIPRSANSAARASTNSSSTSRSTSPPAAILSGTSNRRWRGVRGTGISKNRS